MTVYNCRWCRTTGGSLCNHDPDEGEARMAAWIARHGYRPDGSYVRGWERLVGQFPPANFDWRTQVGPDGRWLRGDPALAALAEGAA